MSRWRWPRSEPASSCRRLQGGPSPGVHRNVRTTGHGAVRHPGAGRQGDAALQLDDLAAAPSGRAAGAFGEDQPLPCPGGLPWPPRRLRGPARYRSWGICGDLEGRGWRLGHGGLSLPALLQVRGLTARTRRAPRPRLERGTYRLGGLFEWRAQLLHYCATGCFSTSCCRSMSALSSPFWHASGTTPVGCGRV